MKNSPSWLPKPMQCFRTIISVNGTILVRMRLDEVGGMNDSLHMHDGGMRPDLASMFAQFGTSHGGGFTFRIGGSQGFRGF